MRYGKFSRIVVLATLMIGLGLTGCARNDGGAPVSFGKAHDMSPDMSRHARMMSSPYMVEVRPGDTLYQIAMATNSSVTDIADYNGIAYPYNVTVGQSIAIPNNKVHIVQRGETIFGISQRYRVETWQLADINNIRYPYEIHVGQELRLTGVNTRMAYAKPAAPTQAQNQWAPAAPKQVSYRSQKVPTPPLMGKSGFMWPVQGRIISTYGPKPDGKHNDGINIAAKKGQSIYAAKSGTVSYVGSEIKGYGNLILIKHADGFVTAYAHTGRMKVQKGDRVEQGQVIASVGSSGAVSSPQLHFEIRRGRKTVNPSRYLTSGV